MLPHKWYQFCWRQTIDQKSFGFPFFDTYRHTEVPSFIPDRWVKGCGPTDRGHVDVARLLLDRAADVMQATEKTALTPAHVAASRGHLETLQASWQPASSALVSELSKKI